jgi:hypothetical protein
MLGQAGFTVAPCAAVNRVGKSPECRPCARLVLCIAFRSARGPSNKSFERLYRDQPSTADLDRAERSGGHEFVEGRAGKAIGARRLVDLISSAMAGGVGFAAFHFFSPCVGHGRN